MQKQSLRCSVRQGVLKKFANFTGKQLCRSIFLWSCKSSTCKFFKNRLQHKCFPVKFARLLRTPILKRSASNNFWRCSIKKLFLKTLQYPQDKSSQWHVLREKGFLWWLIELWKWHVFIMINISCKSSWVNELFFPW